MSAAPPGLSRPHASFIGTVCQGIHHTPMTTTPNKGAVTTAKITITEKPQRHRNKTRHHKGIVPKRSRTNPRKHTPEKGVPSDSNHSTNTRPHHGAECSRPLSSSQTTTPPNQATREQTHATRNGGTKPGTTPTPHKRGRPWRPGNPTARTIRIFHDSSTPAGTPTTGKAVKRKGAEKRGTNVPPRKLRRKEVIQPHLPVRLPCYDLVPITSLTLDGSPHEGRATGFGCYPLS